MDKDQTSDAGKSAVASGASFFQKDGERLAAAGLASGDELLFYAGYLGGLFGHIAAALGVEMADAMVEHLRPTFVQAIRDCEKEQSH